MDIAKATIESRDNMNRLVRSFNALLDGIAWRIDSNLDKVDLYLADATGEDAELLDDAKRDLKGLVTALRAGINEITEEDIRVMQP